MSVQVAATAQEISEQLQVASSQQPTGAGTILLVEDEAFVREVTGEVLRAAGYEVLIANDAPEAIQVYERHRRQVDLLVTDVVLPGESGLALAERLRQGNSGLMVLCITGYAKQMGLRTTGQSDCLAKPYSSEALLKRVAHLVDRGRWSGQKSKARRACGNA